MSAEDAAVQRNNPRSDDAFQRLLLKFSDAAAQGTPAQELIRLFCQATREFFQVDGAYFWQRVSADELVGAEADGVMADRFRGTRVKASQSSVAIAAEAIRQRKTVYENQLDPRRYLMAAEYRARSIMAAPLVVSHDAIGAAVFLHCSDPDFFTPDLAAKATILAGQLGSLLEASRLTQVSREEHRRTKILAEVAQAIHSAPQSAAVVEAVADRLRVLLRTRLVCMMLREGAGFSLNAVAAESSQLAASVRARHDRRGLQFAADLASRAVSAGEPISVAIDPATHALGRTGPAGDADCRALSHFPYPGRGADLSAARGGFQRGGKIADFGGHRICRGRHRQRGTLQHGPGPGLRTPPVAGYLGRTRLHRPAG